MYVWGPRSSRSSVVANSGILPRFLEETWRMLGLKKRGLCTARSRREKTPKAPQLVGEIRALGESEPFRKPVVKTFLIRQLGNLDAQSPWISEEAWRMLWLDARGSVYGKEPSREDAQGPSIGGRNSCFRRIRTISQTRGKNLPYKAVRRIRPPNGSRWACRTCLERPVERPYDKTYRGFWAVGFS